MSCGEEMMGCACAAVDHCQRRTSAHPSAFVDRCRRRRSACPCAAVDRCLGTPSVAAVDGRGEPLFSNRQTHSLTSNPHKPASKQSSSSSSYARYGPFHQPVVVTASHFLCMQILDLQAESSGGFQSEAVVDR
ncbi:hypothetical protein WN943_002466 [Citrus x changshan-huyou]